MPTTVRALLLFLLFLAPASATDQPLSAIEQLNNLQDALRKARADKDWRASLAAANALKQLLNESPNSLLEVARAQVHVEDLTAAFHELEQFVRMGQSSELLAKSSEFATLREQAAFAGIRRGMNANARPVSLASLVFSLADASLLAEDVDYNPARKRFLLTSVREKKIVATDANGTASDFARAPDGWPMLAIKVDGARGVVWATEVALQGSIFAPEADWGRSAVLCFDLKSGALLHRVEGPRGTALGDMALSTSGDVIVSDGDGGGVYRLPAHGRQLERIDGGEFISPQTPALHPDGKRIFVPDYARGIAVLDVAGKQVRWFSTQGKYALDGIDGLYFDHGMLIAVQNGTSPERVVAFKLDASLTRIESRTIIEQSTPTLGDPTHGVVLNHDFYYIANSGWNVIDDHGNLKPGVKLSSPRLMRVPMNKL